MRASAVPWRDWLAATSSACTGCGQLYMSCSPSISVSAPPASCTKRSAAARSQSWLLPLTMVMSTSPWATRASRSASEPMPGQRHHRRMELGERAEEALGTEQLRALESGARPDLDRNAVAGRALAGRREEELLRHRRIERGEPRPAARPPAPPRRPSPPCHRDRRACRRSDRRSRPPPPRAAADRPRFPPTASHRRGTRRRAARAAARRPRYRPR